MTKNSKILSATISDDFFNDFSQLEQIISDLSKNDENQLQNLKIYHFVRDPRALYSEIHQKLGNLDDVGNINVREEGICQSMMQNFRFITENFTRSTNNNFKLNNITIKIIRIEDYYLNRKNMVIDILKDLELDLSLIQKILDDFEDIDFDLLHDSFSHWRKLIYKPGLNLADMIQTECSQIFELLGYNAVDGKISENSVVDIDWEKDPLDGFLKFKI